MAPPPVIFGHPVDMETDTTEHRDEHGTLWRRKLTTIFVDQGGPHFVPFRFEAWLRWEGFGLWVPEIDAPIPMEEDPATLRPALYDGEIIDPEPESSPSSPMEDPMDTEPSSPEPEEEVEPEEEFEAEESDPEE